VELAVLGASEGLRGPFERGHVDGGRAVCGEIGQWRGGTETGL